MVENIPDRYLKTVVADQVVHILAVPEEPGLVAFADFMTDLADAEREGGTIIIDLTGVQLVDGRVLEGIQRATRRIRMRGDRFALACNDPRLLKLLTLVGVDGTSVTFASVPEALLSLEAG